MPCHEWEDQLTPLLDGELPAAERGAVREHLRSCSHVIFPVCGEVFVVENRNGATAGFEDRLGHRLAQEGLPATQRPKLRRWLPFAGLAAASLLLLVLNRTWMNPPIPQPAPPQTATPSAAVDLPSLSAALDAADTPCLSAIDCGLPTPYPLSAAAPSPPAGWCEGRPPNSPGCEEPGLL